VEWVPRVQALASDARPLVSVILNAGIAHIQSLTRTSTGLFACRRRMRAVVFLIHLRGHCIEHTESFDISALVEHLAEDGKADLQGAESS